MLAAIEIGALRLDLGPGGDEGHVVRGSERRDGADEDIEPLLWTGPGKRPDAEPAVPAAPSGHEIRGGGREAAGIDAMGHDGDALRGDPEHRGHLVGEGLV